MSALQSIGTASGDRLLRPSEVMHRLSVSRATAYRLLNDGTLPVVRFGAAPRGGNKMLRVRESALVEWMKENETRPGRKEPPKD